jgi:beta-lactamase class A
MAQWVRYFRSGRGIVLGGLVAAAALAGGLVSADRAVRLASAPLTAARLEIQRKQAPPAPAALQARLDELAAAYGEEVGIAVTDVTQGWTAGVDHERPYPQQSVSKLWVAIAVMKAADEGRLDPYGWVPSSTSRYPTGSGPADTRPRSPTCCAARWWKATTPPTTS